MPSTDAVIRFKTLNFCRDNAGSHYIVQDNLSLQSPNAKVTNTYYHAQLRISPFLKDTVSGGGSLSNFLEANMHQPMKFKLLLVAMASTEVVWKAEVRMYMFYFLNKTSGL